jgi:hypothetical protein
MRIKGNEEMYNASICSRDPTETHAHKFGHEFGETKLHVLQVPRLPAEEASGSC